MKSSCRVSLFLVSLLLDTLVGALTGVYSHLLSLDLGPLWSYLALEAAGISTTACALLFSGVHIGTPDMGSRWLFNILSSVVIACWIMLLLVAVGTVWPKADLYARFFCALSSVPVFLPGLRGLPGATAAIFLVIALVVRLGLCVSLDRELDMEFVPMIVKFAIAISLGCHTCYLRDQRLVLSICSQPIWAYAIGVALSKLMHEGFSYFVLARMVLYAAVGVALIFVNLAMRRRGRHLPPGLIGVRFIRLGYLRAMAAEGKGIRRCQELPPEAFGDPFHCMHLIAISHRWLHQDTCDVFTPELPQGCKLGQILERLEAHFSLKALSTRSGWRSLRSVHAACCVGGWDVLVFLDYTSVPQLGFDGEAPIPRTPEEQAVFQECLPNMGTLYSIYPVMILDTVPAGCPALAYDDSGWCYLEFAIAMMGRQLERYSMDSVTQRRGSVIVQLCSGDFDTESVGTREDIICTELSQKNFHDESDRKVAIGIIRGFLGKRLLADSIRRGEYGEFKRLLQHLVGLGLSSTLNEPVDDGLNTLLHLAVRHRFERAALDILSCGAAANIRNLRGDLPWQWFSLPLFGGRTAAACRRHGDSRTSF